MILRTDEARVKAQMRAAAKIWKTRWETIPRKHPYECEMAFAFDHPQGGLDIVKSSIAWADMEKLTEDELFDRFFAACYKKPTN